MLPSSVLSILSTKDSTLLFPFFLSVNDLCQGILQMGSEQGIQVLTLLYHLCLQTSYVTCLCCSFFFYENSTPL